MRVCTLFAALIVAASSSLVACSGTTTPTGGPVESPPESPASPGSPGSAGSSSESDASADSQTPPVAADPQCNAIAQEGIAVSLVADSYPPPPPLGGTIADGTYVLTSAKRHKSTAPDGAVSVGPAGTLAITGTAFQNIKTDSKGSATRSSGTLAASETKVTLTTTCEFPAGTKGEPEVFSYTVKDATIRLLSAVPAANGGGTIDLVYTKK